jgi:hypothetical protein
MLFNYPHVPHRSQARAETQECSKAGISISTIYTIGIMSDFTITELLNSLSYETKFFLVSEGFLYAKGHSRQPRNDSGFLYHAHHFCFIRDTYL